MFWCQERRHFNMLAVLLALVRFASSVVTSQSEQPIVVDITGADIATRVAVEICAGLMNRDSASGNGVYTLYSEPYDSDWLSDLYHIDNPVITPIPQLMALCLSSAASGYISYNYAEQNLVVPNLITLASVLDGVLLEDGSPFIGSDTRLLFDSVTEWKNYSALEATQYMYTNYVGETTTLAFMDPNPVVNTGLIDYIVKTRVFNLFLNDACVPLTKEWNLFKTIVTPENNPWSNPIGVMGYNDAWPLAGDIFEAETDCDSLHNMGQIASDGCSNLAYLSRSERITTTMEQNPTKDVIYDSNRTYIAFTIGDGDNLSYLKSTRRDWMVERVTKCKESNFSYLGCFPLQWSMSPHPLHLAPKLIQWYYNRSYETGLDWFVLPPSGDLYSYASEMDYDTAQKSYVANTENDCTIMGCESSVAWEFAFHWSHAEKYYFPRYATNAVIRGMYAVNVPFNVPIADFWIPMDQFYKILGSDAANAIDGVIVYRPREWRGANHKTCNQNIPFTYLNCLTEDQMAKEINTQYPKGTITHIYVTSDGGGDLQMIYNLVAKLDTHVSVVAPKQLNDLVWQKETA